MRARRYEFGRAEEATHPDSMRATLAEFLSTLIRRRRLHPCSLLFGFGLAAKIYKESSITAADMVVVAVAHGFSLFAAMSAAINISGGHVNPAVTMGVLLGGRISLVRAVFYWVAQLLAAVVASLLLRLVTAGKRPEGFYVSSGIGVWNGLLFEIVMTFGLVYVFYATAVDPKRGGLGMMAPLAVGLILGANMLAGGPFDGACMNPARAFGPALVGWRWRNHWIYWVGPLLGGGLAGVIYEFMVIPAVVDQPPRHAHQPLAPEDY